MYLVVIYVSLFHLWALIFVQLKCGELCRCMPLHFFLLTQCLLLLLPEKLLFPFPLVLKIALEVRSVRAALQIIAAGIL